MGAGPTSPDAVGIGLEGNNVIIGENTSLWLSTPLPAMGLSAPQAEHRCWPQPPGPLTGCWTMNGEQGTQPTPWGACSSLSPKTAPSCLPSDTELAAVLGPGPASAIRSSPGGTGSGERPRREAQARSSFSQRPQWRHETQDLVDLVLICWGGHNSTAEGVASSAEMHPPTAMVAGRLRPSCQQGAFP